MTRVLVAPQELKGTLTAQQAVAAMAAALKRTRPAWNLQLVPLADGGPGTVHLVLRRMIAAHARRLTVKGPLGTEVEATWALLPDDTAVIEMAQASGLSLVPAEARHLLEATTFGTGQLIHAALDAGCRRIIIGAGGSATNDAGLGALRALGVRFLDSQDAEIWTPASLARVAKIDLSRQDPRLGRASLEVWTDVRNPLLGPTGATRMFGAQKGGTEPQLDALEHDVRHLSQLAKSATGLDLAPRPGAGAAGGLAWGLATFCDAAIHPGFLSLASLLSLDTLIDKCDLVLTGEGCLDQQTALEKGPWALARLAKLREKPVVAFVGRCSIGPDTWRGRLSDVVVLEPGVPTTRQQAAQALETAVAQWALKQVDRAPFMPSLSRHGHPSTGSG